MASQHLKPQQQQPATVGLTMQQVCGYAAVVNARCINDKHQMQYHASWLYILPSDRGVEMVW